MSQIAVTVERVNAVEPHPNADRLEIVKILGTQTIVPKGEFKIGDWVIFFPPDILLPSTVSERLGVQQYLRSAVFDGQKIPCRVAACRLRGIPSYGFIASLATIKGVSNLYLGCDITHLFGALKYEPLQTIVGGDLAAEPAEFHRYTDIQHYYRYPSTIQPGTPVRITEKIHGTNARFGLLRLNDEWVYMAGSHKTARKKYNSDGRLSLYWRPLEMLSILNLLADLCDETNNVVIFAELFGPDIQDLDYGVSAGKIGCRIFDISINGRYLDWKVVAEKCYKYGVPTVPLLYTGDFSPDFVVGVTNGPTIVALEVKSEFKGREGCVITPLKESYDTLLGRVILKSVSADYLSRKGGTDNG